TTAGPHTIRSTIFMDSAPSCIASPSPAIGRADRMTISARLRNALRPTVSNQVLLLLCLMYLILYVDRVNISTAAPLIKAELGLSNTELGLVFSAFAYPYALFQLIGGYFGDKFGARLTLAISGLIVCAATAATGAVGGLASLFA